MWKVLLPVDGSDCALRAVRYFIEMAAARDDVSATLLYVHYVPMRFGAVAAQVLPEDIRRMESEHAEPVMSSAETLLSEANIPFEREFRAAVDVAPTIAKRAEELGCDAIFMGAHGGGALARMLTGSTATKVVHLVKVPVTLVK